MPGVKRLRVDWSGPKYAAPLLSASPLIPSALGLQPSPRPLDMNSGGTRKSACTNPPLNLGGTLEINPAGTALVEPTGSGMRAPLESTGSRLLSRANIYRPNRLKVRKLKLKSAPAR